MAGEDALVSWLERRRTLARRVIAQAAWAPAPGTHTLTREQFGQRARFAARYPLTRQPTILHPRLSPQLPLLTAPWLARRLSSRSAEPFTGALPGRPLHVDRPPPVALFWQRRLSPTGAMLRRTRPRISGRPPIATASVGSPSAVAAGALPLLAEEHIAEQNRVPDTVLAPEPPVAHAIPASLATSNEPNSLRERREEATPNPLRGLLSAVIGWASGRSSEETASPPESAGTRASSTEALAGADSSAEPPTAWDGDAPQGEPPLPEFATNTSDELLGEEVTPGPPGAVAAQPVREGPPMWRARVADDGPDTAGAAPHEVPPPPELPSPAISSATALDLIAPLAAALARRSGRPSEADPGAAPIDVAPWWGVPRTAAPPRVGTPERSAAAGWPSPISGAPPEPPLADAVEDAVSPYQALAAPADGAASWEEERPRPDGSTETRGSVSAADDANTAHAPGSAAEARDTAAELPATDRHLLLGTSEPVEPAGAQSDTSTVRPSFGSQVATRLAASASGAIAFAAAVAARLSHGTAVDRDESDSAPAFRIGWQTPRSAHISATAGPPTDDRATHWEAKRHGRPAQPTRSGTGGKVGPLDSQSPATRPAHLVAVSALAVRLARREPWLPSRAAARVATIAGRSWIGRRHDAFERERATDPGDGSAPIERGDRGSWSLDGSGVRSEAIRNRQNSDRSASTRPPSASPARVPSRGSVVAVLAFEQLAAPRVDDLHGRRLEEMPSDGEHWPSGQPRAVWTSERPSGVTTEEAARTAAGEPLPADDDEVGETAGMIGHEAAAPSPADGGSADRSAAIPTTGDDAEAADDELTRVMLALPPAMAATAMMRGALGRRHVAANGEAARSARLSAPLAASRPAMPRPSAALSHTARLTAASGGVAASRPALPLQRQAAEPAPADPPPVVTREPAHDEPDLDELADEVFAILRWRLAAEQERLATWR